MRKVSTSCWSCSPCCSSMVANCCVKSETANKVGTRKCGRISKSLKVCRGTTSNFGERRKRCRIKTKWWSPLASGWGIVYSKSVQSFCFVKVRRETGRKEKKREKGCVASILPVCAAAGDAYPGYYMVLWTRSCKSIIASRMRRKVDENNGEGKKNKISLFPAAPVPFPIIRSSLAGGLLLWATTAAPSPSIWKRWSAFSILSSYSTFCLFLFPFISQQSLPGIAY